MTNVRLTETKNQRARNRVREHGERFTLLLEGLYDGRPAVLCKALTKGTEGHWFGWFTDDEAIWEIEK
jgi:hypothetical protein